MDVNSWNLKDNQLLAINGIGGQVTPKVKRT